MGVWRRNRRPIGVNGPRWWGRRGPHRRRRGSRWRGRGRGAELEHQPGPVLRIAKSDRPTVVDEDRRHPHAVDVDPAFAAIDGNPLRAVVMQHDVGGGGGRARAAEADIRPAVVADGDISARGEGVPAGSEPDDQRGSKRLRRHGHPPSAPIILESCDPCPPAMMRREPTQRRRCWTTAPRGSPYRVEPGRWAGPESSRTRRSTVTASANVWRSAALNPAS